jgi:methylmalonyl-CoA/ethylmalonyl-CoA epimerase
MNLSIKHAFLHLSNFDEMNKIEHIGIAVKNLQEACSVYESLLGVSSYKKELVDSEGVNTAFFQTGINKIELLEATHNDSPIAKFLEKRGEGIHHIAFDVDNIVQEMSRLKGQGFVLLNDEPKMGADNKLVCFVHPKGTKGVLVELCQEINNC